MQKFKPGDLVRNRWGDLRMIFLTKDDGVMYLDYYRKEDAKPDFPYKGYIYKPTSAFVTNATMEKYEKVGEMPPAILEKFLADLTSITAVHHEAFVLQEKLLGTDEYRAENFIK